MSGRQLRKARAGRLCRASGPGPGGGREARAAGPLAQPQVTFASAQSAWS